MAAENLLFPHAVAICDVDGHEHRHGPNVLPQRHTLKHVKFMDNGEKSGSNIKEIPAIIQGRYKKKQMANGRGKEEGERAKGKGERKPVKSKRRLPSDAEIRKAIIEARRHTFNAEALEDEAQYFSSLYNHLLDFANTPNYPDHIIEKKNILRYYFQLEYQLGGYAAKPEQIATYMKRDWGEDWEEKLDNEKRRLG